MNVIIPIKWLHLVPDFMAGLEVDKKVHKKFELHVQISTVTCSKVG